MSSMRAAALLILLVAWGSDLGAVEVEGLYEAEVPVLGQAREERSDAIRTALRAVLIKVSGMEVAPQSPAFADLLDQADSFVQQYRYVTRTEPVPDQTLPAEKKSLWVRFDTQSVNRTLRNAGFPVWGRARPALLVWLAVEDAGRRHLLGPGDQPDLGDALRAGARARGLPLLIPLMDLEDEQNLTFADVWAGFGERIVAASARYQTEGVLAGRLLRTGENDWNARWTLFYDGKVWNWDAYGAADLVLNAGVNRATDTLAAGLARSADSGMVQLHIRVTDVASVDGYARAERFLRSLEPVLTVNAIDVGSTEVVFEVSVRGDRSNVEQAIALSNVALLAPLHADPLVPAAAGGDSTAADLSYRLVP